MPDDRPPPPNHSVDRVYYASLDDAVIPTRRSTVDHHHHPSHHVADQQDNGSVSSHYEGNGSASESEETFTIPCFFRRGIAVTIPSVRQMALTLSLYCNIAITLAKFIAYLQTFSLSVLAALLDSVLDVVSQAVLNYTEQHSSMQRSSAFYPAGASRLETIGVLTCAALMGMASFEVLKESSLALLYPSLHDLQPHITAVYSMITILMVKLALLWLCRRGANKRLVKQNTMGSNGVDNDPEASNNEMRRLLSTATESSTMTKHVIMQLADPTLEALAQDHLNDSLSNGVAAVALVAAVHSPHLWFLDPMGAIVISVYIIYSWFTTGKEQIEHLTGKSAPEEFIQELIDLANDFDDRIAVDTVRAYHFGPKFLVEIEIVMDAATLLFESHDLGMDLQYEIEGREEVERCFVHIDYQARPYDEHVVSKVPELKEKYLPKTPSVKQVRSAQSI
jgi:cation diffusion facilitator family transporter